MGFKQTPDTLRSEDTFEGVLGVGIGPMKGPVNGLQSITLDGTSIEDASGTLNFEDTLVITADGHPAKFPQIVTPQLGAAASPISVNLQVGNTNPAGTPGPFVVKSVPNLGASFLDLRFVVNQLYSQNDDGIFGTTANLEVQLKPTGTTNWISPQLSVPADSYSPTGQVFNDVLRAWVPRKFYGADGTWLPETNNGYLPIIGKTTTPFVYELRISVPNSGAYLNKGWDVRVRLREVESLDADPDFAKRIINWESVSAVYPEQMGSHEDWRGLAWMQIVAKASDQLAGLPEVAAVYDAKIVQTPPATVYNPDTRQYTGTMWDGSWSSNFTNDPAWVINDALSDGLSGLSLLAPGSHLNKWDALDASKFFSELVPDGNGGTHPRYTLNLVVDQVQKAEEFIQYMAGAVGAFAWDQGDGEWRMVVDRVTNPVDIFTQDNIRGDFAYSHTDVDTRYNDIKMTFLNAEQDYRQDFVQVFDSPSISISGRKPTSIVAVGCTNRQEALRRAMVRLRASINETRMVTFTTNRRGKLLQQFSNILIADVDMGNRTVGRVLSVAGNRLSVTLRDPVRLEVGINYNLVFSVPNPLYNPDSTTQPTSSDYIAPTLTTSIAVTNTSAQRGDVATLYLASALPNTVSQYLTVALQAAGLPTNPKLYRVVELKPGEGEEAEFITLTAIEVDTGKQAAADNVSPSDSVLQPPPDVVPPPIVPANGKALSLVAIPNNYTLFASWRKPDSSWISGYQVKYRANGGAWITLADKTKETTIEILTAPSGTYDLEVRSIDRLGRYSAPLVDTLNVAGYDGTALTMALTKDSVALPANAAGVVSDFSLAAGAINVFYGTANVTAKSTLTVVSQINCTGTVNAAGNYAVTAMSADTASLTLQATYKGVTVTKTFSLTKAIAGLSASVLSLTTTAQTFTYDGSGNASPATQTITLTANLQNLSGTVSWSAIAYDANGTSLGAVTLGGSGAVRTLTNTQFVAPGATARVVVTASLAGFSDTMTIVRLAGGANGTSGTSASLLTLSTSAQTFNYDAAGVASPTTQTISFSANTQNLPGTATWTATAYNAAGTSLGAITLGGTGNTRTMTNAQFLAPGATAYAVVTATIGAFSDTVSVVKLSAGADAVTGFLTNEAATLSADSAGNVSSFATASGNFKVFQGLVDKTASAAYSIVGTPTGCTVAINATSGAYSVSAMSADTASAVLQAVYNGVTIQKTLTLAKSRAGAQGPAGSSAAVLTLTNTAQTMSFDAAGNASPSSQTITFTANLQNLTGTATWTATAYDAAGTNLGAVTLGGTGNSRTMTVAQFTALAGTSYVTVVASLSGQSDTTSIVKLSAGAAGAAGSSGQDAITGFLTNEAATLAADSAGNVASFTAAGGRFKVFNGLTDRSGSATYSIVSATGATASLTTNGVYSISAMSADTATVVFQADYLGLSIQKTLSLSKSKAGPSGAAGADAVTGFLTNEAATLAADVNGNVASFAGGAGTFKVFQGLVDVTTSSAFSVVSTNSCTVAINATSGAYTVSAMSNDTAFATLQAVYNGVTIQKRLSLSKSRVGSTGDAAIAGYLTNESTNLFAYASGDVSSYSGATGSFKVFSGSADVSSNFTLSTLANPQALTVSYLNQTYTVSGGFDANEDYASLTIRATGTGTYAGVVLDKVFSLSKAKGGYEIVSALPTTNLFEGRVVYLTSDGKLYRYNGTAWTAAVAAADLSGTLSSSQIAALDAAKLTGTLSADLIAANTLTASKLALIDTNNLLMDPTFLDAGYSTATSYWYLGASSASSALAFAVVAGTAENTAVVAPRGLKTPVGNGTATQTQSSAYVTQSNTTVEPGKPYRAYCRVAIATGFSGLVRLLIRWYKSDGTTAASTATQFVTSTGNDFRTVKATAASTIVLEGQVTAPDDAAFMRFECRVDWSTTLANTGYAVFGGPRFMRAMNAELVVDGQITANALAANAVTASKIAAGEIKAAALDASSAVITNTIQIANAVIKTANIDDAQISGAKIKDLEVDTIKIKNNAISVTSQAYTASAAGTSSANAWVTVQTLSVTTKGGTCNILGSINMPFGQCNGTANNKIRIVRDAVVLYLGDLPLTPVTLTGTSSGSAVQNTVTPYVGGITSPCIGDNPTAALHTYTLQVMVDKSGLAINNAFLSCTELLK